MQFVRVNERETMGREYFWASSGICMHVMNWMFVTWKHSEEEFDGVEWIEGSSKTGQKV